MKFANLNWQIGLLLSVTLFTAFVAQASVNQTSKVERGTLLLNYLQDNKQVSQSSPLVSTQVKMQVTGLLARVTLTQQFTNPGEHWANGVYLFPLPENSAVDHLQMQVGERVIIGEIKPKAEAKKVFEQAKRAGKKATLLQQQRANMFTTRIANIAPGESISITLEYQQQVDYRDGRFSLRFPMTITPRYLPAARVEGDFSERGFASQVQINAPMQHEHELPAQLNLQVQLDAGVALDKIESEFHPLVKNRLSDSQYQLHLAQKTAANRDFVLNWWPTLGVQPKAALFSQQHKGEQYGLLMLLPPQPKVVEQPLSREVIFVLDTSGSMQGASILQAKQALVYAINNLTANDSFNLIEFNSHARALWQSAVPADDMSKAEALGFVHGLQADGGTEMRQALQLALQDVDFQNQQNVRQVLFITDGSVGNESELMGYIKANLGRSRLFPIGIGSAPNSYFMAEAARMGKGSFVYIGSTSQVQSKLRPLLDKLQRPVIADLAAQFSQQVETYPQQLGDLYAGEPLLLSFRADTAPDEVKITGKTGQQSWALAVPTQQGAEQAGLNVRWARNKIESMHRAYRLDRSANNQKADLKQAIVDTAMQHHLVSPFTSLVAVEQKISRLEGVKSLDKDIPRARPAGWKSQGVGQLPQTATDAPWLFKMGGLLLGGSLCLLVIARRF